jgi:guanosine-3',5'-bis(diphosphate) 3'-pyrophosphohydrolase
MENPKVEQAREMAVRAHKDQKYGEHPYVKHLDDVAGLLKPFGTKYQIVGYLHDTLEDTDMDPDEIQDQFGSDVRLAVEALTDPPGKNRKERKAKSYEKFASLGNDAEWKLIALTAKGADRLANIRNSVATKNHGLLDMYKKENDAFVNAVFRPGLNTEFMIEILYLLGKTDDWTVA